MEGERRPEGAAIGGAEPEELPAGGLTGRIEQEMELLQRHVNLLKAVVDHQPIGIIRLSEVTGYPQHKVRYSLRVLEQEGLIHPSPQGAMASERVQEFLPKLRQLLDSITTVAGQLREKLL
jgi:predicted transcriptional regulator